MDLKIDLLIGGGISLLGGVFQFSSSKTSKTYAKRQNMCISICVCQAKIIKCLVYDGLILVVCVLQG